MHEAWAGIDQFRIMAPGAAHGAALEEYGRPDAWPISGTELLYASYQPRQFHISDH